MRICFVTAEYPPMQGGVGDCTRELGRALLQLGHQVVVLTSTAAAQSGNAAGEDKSRHLPGEGELVVRPVIRHWGWRSWAQILQTAREAGSEILHVQYQTGAFGMHPAVNFLPVRLRMNRKRPRCCRAEYQPRVVFTFHDLRVPYLFPKAGIVRRWATLLPARWSDAVIATNEEDYRELEQALGPRGGGSNFRQQRKNVLQWIPIGSNIYPQPFAGYDRTAWRNHLGVGTDETLLCYFGFLNESKGGETLLRCLDELVGRGRQVKLLMIGGQVGDSDPTNAAYFRRVQDLSHQLGLSDRLLWTGYTAPSEVSAHFMAADVCVLPYRDGVSFRRGSFMAALAHGLPIVSTQPRTPSPMLVSGENVFLVPPDDALAAADAVERLLASPQLCARLRRGALDLASNFSWDRIGVKTAQLYAELLHAAQLEGRSRA